MDISFNENVEKVKIRDIFAGLKDIFIGNNSTIDDGELNKEIDKIIEVEKETGGTANIAALVKQIQTHTTEKTKRKSTKVLTKKTEIKEEIKNIEDEERESDR